MDCMYIGAEGAFCKTEKLGFCSDSEEHRCKMSIEAARLEKAREEDSGEKSCRNCRNFYEDKPCPHVGECTYCRMGLVAVFLDMHEPI